MENQEIERQQRAYEAIGKVLHIQACKKQNANRNCGTGNRGAEIALENNEANGHKCREHRPKKGSARIVHGLGPVRKKEGQEQNQYWTGQFRSIEGESGKVD